MNYFLGIDATKKLVADFEEASCPNHPVVSTITIPDNVWTHVALTLNMDQAKYVSLRLVDMNGKTVYQKNAFMQKGSNSVPLNVSEKQLASGVYILTINGNGLNYSKK